MFLQAGDRYGACVCVFLSVCKPVCVFTTDETTGLIVMEDLKAPPHQRQMEGRVSVCCFFSCSSGDERGEDFWVSGLDI